MTYEELLTESDSMNLIVKEKDIPGYGGRICNNRIAIHKGLSSQSEKACVLAEELGHYHTTYEISLMKATFPIGSRNFGQGLGDMINRLAYLV